MIEMRKLLRVSRNSCGEPAKDVGSLALPNKVRERIAVSELSESLLRIFINLLLDLKCLKNSLKSRSILGLQFSEDRGDVPGWVLVVLMTTGLVTGIWTLAAPRIDSILRNSLDSMNNIR
jgi:uncharacterized membrane protein YqjE